MPMVGEMRYFCIGTMRQSHVDLAKMLGIPHTMYHGFS